MTEELKVIISAEISKLKSATDKAKNEIKSFKDQVDKAKKDVDDNFKSMGDGIGKAMTVGAATATAALASVGTALAALTKASVSNYAEYEQLTGGVETLFKDSSDAVMKYAENAYKTAGMSANEYMSTVTGFSASLLQSLGGDTAAAAKAADMALSDMADNANKMGTSMESIQNAYGGFAKQNYTMLDNLKLGYSGSREEMERLLADAEKFSGIKYDINSLDDVYQAIHVIQNEMGITGTTAKEASSTISGSIGMTKAAWTNLMTGLADGNANIPQLVQNVIASASDVLKNVIPVIKEVIKNIPVAISEISPEAGAAFQKVVDVIMEVLPILKDALQVAFDLIVDTINFVSENTGIITAAAVAIGVITTAIGLYNTVAAIKAAMAAAEVTSVWGLVSAYAAQAAAMALALAPYLLIAAAIAAVIAIIVLCVKHWDTIKETILNVTDTITTAIGTAWDWLAGVFTTIVNWINDNLIKPITKFFTDLWNGIVNGFNTVIGPWIEIIKRASIIIYDTVIKPIKDKFDEMVKWFKSTVIEPIGNFFGKMWDKLSTGAKKAWDGIKSVFSTITSWFKDKFTQAWTAVKNVLSVGGKIFDGIKDGIASVFKTVVNGIIGGINKVIAVPFKAINNALAKIRDISILGVEPFTWIKTFSVPQIPLLAKGGVVESATLAMVGEQGKEMVMPLENNLEYLDKLASMITERMGGNNRPVVLNVDGKVFAQTAISTINENTRQTGSLKLNIM